MRRAILRTAAIVVIACGTTLVPASLASALEDGDIVVTVEIRPRPAPPGDDLVRTGVDPLPLVALAVALGVAGGAVLVVGDRRRRSGEA